MRDVTGIIRRAVLTAAVLLAALGPTAAETVPPDPWQVIHIARENGAAEVGRDAMKDPEITVARDGQTYRIGFYGCHLGRNCQSLLFQVRFQIPTEKRKALARWNERKLFGRAWLDAEGRAVLDHPVAMAGGLPDTTLRATFDAWQRAVGEFRDFLTLSRD